ncbi:MAG: Wzy polymerase domain-containing protein [Burkholderiaceae bacterium]
MVSTSASYSTTSTGGHTGLSGPYTVAVAAPALLAYNLAPSATLLNQLLALAGWGVVLAAVPKRGLGERGDLNLLWAALGALAVAVVVSMQMSLPSPLAWSALALLAAAALVATHGHAGDARGAAAAAEGFHTALLLAGLASSVIALIQVFAPGLADGNVVARSGLPGRAVGNLRQPNHLSSLLLWAMIGWVPLAQAGRVAGARLARPLALGLGALLVWALVLTASRTGIVGVVLLAAWGAADRRLSRWVRVALIAAPVAYLVLALGMSGWAHVTGHTYGGEARLSEGDVSASRYGIWSNTWDLIKAQPWTGVGFGEFNFAWTLSAFPGRPTAFFDHTHNLPLQLLVELGAPLGLLVLLLLLGALLQSARRSWQVEGEAGAGARAAFMVVLMIGLHSLFEYPLWYAYFLLPAAWAWGHALRSTRPAIDWGLGPGRVSWGLRLGGAALIAGAAFAVFDYWKVVVIYAPSDDAAPLAERIEHGQGSLFFSNQADYAAATTTEPPSQAMAAFDSATHVLLDTRLMMDWAQALAESGHRDKASYLAARLREFRNPASAEFFQVCSDPVAAPSAASAAMPDRLPPPPFQCEPPPDSLSWRDFRPRAE